MLKSTTFIILNLFILLSSSIAFNTFTTTRRTFPLTTRTCCTISTNTACKNSKIHSIRPSSSSLLIHDNKNGESNNSFLKNHNRRNFLSQISKGLIIGAISTSNCDPFVSIANAADDSSGDLTSQMFNEDGSLKGNNGNNIEAQSKTVNVSFPIKNNDNASNTYSAIVNLDGKFITKSANLESDGGTSLLKTSYQTPDKWTSAPDYYDTLLSSQQKACDHIMIYQVPGTFKDYSTLDKATALGVAKALNFDSIGSETYKSIFPKSLNDADVISGRKVYKKKMGGDVGREGEGEGGGDSSNDKKDNNQQLYYEFDVAIAPTTCEQSTENLNLGFCPYDTIVLISATIVSEKMMVCAVSCNKDMWKRANADLKRVRGSFVVETDMVKQEQSV